MQPLSQSTFTILLALFTASLHGADLASTVRQRSATVPSGGGCSCAVLDLLTGTWVVQQDADTPQRLASVTKLLVSAAALSALGPEFHFRTDLVAVGTRTTGVLDGLAVIGRGSPCLDEHFTNKDPDSIFRTWAAALRQAGVTGVAGDLVIDARYFSGPDKGTSWPQDHYNRQQWFSAPASAFAWNDNCIEVRARPGAGPGKPAVIDLRPTSSRIRIVNQALTVAANGDKSFLVARAAAANEVTIKGRYHAATAFFPMAIHQDPDLLAGDHLKHVFAAEGIAIAGQVRLGVAPAGAPLLHRHQDRLGPAIDLLNQRSQNFYGEQILRTLGAERTGEGSAAAGSRAALATLAELGLDTTSITLDDGSGLGYANRASAAAICRLLAVMHAGQHGAAFRASLKTDGAGVLVKTGTLLVARCLAGYIDAPSGKRYAFAILVGQNTARSFDWGTRLKDALKQDLLTSLRR